MSEKLTQTRSIYSNQTQPSHCNVNFPCRLPFIFKILNNLTILYIQVKKRLYLVIVHLNSVKIKISVNIYHDNVNKVMNSLLNPFFRIINYASWLN